MSQFNPCVITQKGFELLAKVQAGVCKLTFTKAQTGDGTYTSSDNLNAQTKLKSKKQEFPISSKKVRNDNSVCLTTIVTNENLVTGYYLKEFGIFALDQAGEEILYAIATAVENKWDYIPDYNYLSPASITIDSYIIVSSAQSVTLQGGFEAYASAEELTALAGTVETIKNDINKSSLTAKIRRGYIGFDAGRKLSLETVTKRGDKITVYQASGSSTIAVSGIKCIEIYGTFLFTDITPEIIKEITIIFAADTTQIHSIVMPINTIMPPIMLDVSNVTNIGIFGGFEWEDIAAETDSILTIREL